MPAGASRKRERQYEHIKENALEHGVSERRAEEIAARAVNNARAVDQQRAREGGAKAAGRPSTQETKSAPHRGGERSRRGPQEPTRDQLYEEAKRKNIEGRSTMNKDELRRAVGR
ncbi:plasmid stabilization protein [Streptomyces sp. NPDC002446]